MILLSLDLIQDRIDDLLKLTFCVDEECFHQIEPVTTEDVVGSSTAYFHLLKKEPQVIFIARRFAKNRARTIFLKIADVSDIKIYVPHKGLICALHITRSGKQIKSGFEIRNFLLCRADMRIHGVNISYRFIINYSGRRIGIVEVLSEVKYVLCIETVPICSLYVCVQILDNFFASADVLKPFSDVRESGYQTLSLDHMKLPFCCMELLFGSTDLLFEFRDRHRSGRKCCGGTEKGLIIIDPRSKWLLCGYCKDDNGQEQIEDSRPALVGFHSAAPGINPYATFLAPCGGY